uniref:Membrane protein n=1 Tax=uncultured Alphaproteobacteria bacterium TaxID=91750 RepID=A0A6G8F3G4_9PROT|nr:membrane protein [uncultured Alphaproteobacteria bacterium]
MVHYRPKLFGGWRSSIDSEGFFLAPDGRTNPEAELEATIKLFKTGTDKDKICLFPARYIFLKNNKLANNINVKCEDFLKFRYDLQPSGVTLLFTDAYMNNPSSLFGHTLLRIDTARKGTQLLAHGANYGAFTNGQENSVLYALYGLGGGYYGGWTVKPYYDIINTYNNIENRDIWELSLNFLPEELDMFVAHLWEVGHTQTRYYFFTKNCSYMIMEMLDAVRPSLNLSEKFPLQAIPLDTVKAVYQSPDLVAQLNYRPSRQGKILHRVRQMNKEQKQALIRAVSDNDYSLDGVSDADKADVLETAYQYVQYQFVKKEFEISEYRRRSFKGLTARNKLSDKKARMSENPQGRSPLKAHEAMRATLGFGNRNGEAFQEIAYRPAYHSLTDNDYGLLTGAEINFLNSRWRHYDRSHKNVLSEFNIVGIRSLSPVDRLFTPTSFNVNWDIWRALNPETQDEGYASRLNAGGGATVAVSDNLWLFVNGGIEMAYGGFLPHSQYVGAEFSAGAYLHFSRFKLLAEAKKVYATTWLGSKSVYKAEVNIPVAANWGLSAEYYFEDNSKGRNSEEFLTSVRHYF